MDTMSKDALTFLCGVAVHAEMDELLPRFRKQTGTGVEVTYDVNPAVAKRTMEGERFDVGLSNPWFFAEMASRGRILPDIHVPFGRVPLTIGAAGAAPGMLVDSEAGVRDLLLAATSIAYISIGTSGKTFLHALDMMGIKDQIADRLRPMGAGEPPIAAAKGDVQFAVAPLTRIVAAPGVSPVAIFPPELELDIPMSMFVQRDADRESALRLIGFLSDPGLDALLLARGVHRYELTDEGDTSLG